MTGFPMFPMPTVPAPGPNRFIIGVATVELFSPAECVSILKTVRPDDWEAGTVERRASGHEVVGARCAEVQVIRNDDTGWPSSTIVEAIRQTNDRYFRFALGNFIERDPISIVRYRVNEGSLPGRFQYHIDLTASSSWRKLSFVLQLSDPTSYGGCETRFWNRPDCASRLLGSLTVFPSYLPHEVTPITRGERLAVVGWVPGPPFQ